MVKVVSVFALLGSVALVCFQSSLLPFNEVSQPAVVTQENATAQEGVVDFDKKLKELSLIHI